MIFQQLSYSRSNVDVNCLIYCFQLSTSPCKITKFQLDNAKRGIPSQGGVEGSTLTYDPVTLNQ